MSLEYIIKELNKYFKFNNLENIYKEKEDNDKYSFSVFDYLLEDNTLEIIRTLENNKRKYKINMVIPFEVEESKDGIKKIYETKYKLSNLSFYVQFDSTLYFTIKDNSIMIFKSILNDNDIIDMKKVIESNKNKIKCIIVNEISKNIKKENLINFIIENEIPVYIIENREYKKFIDFFIKGEGASYIKLYENNNYYRQDNLNIFDIIKLTLDNEKEIEETNPIKNMIKNIGKNNYNKILENPYYKTRLCKSYKIGINCKYGNNCNFAHGEEEIREINKIRDYIINNDEEKEKRNQYKKKREKIIKELIDESKNIFDILNIKLTKRFIFDILCMDCIKLDDISNIFFDIKNIFEIFEILSLEYYFNCEYNISNEFLREKILNSFIKLSNDKKGKDIQDNLWIINCFKQIENINYKQQKFSLTDLNLINLFNEKKLLEKFYSSPNVIYDKLLFLSENIIKENNIEYFLENYINMLNRILNNIVEKNIILNNNRNESELNYECLILSKIMQCGYLFRK